MTTTTLTGDELLALLAEPHRTVLAAAATASFALPAGWRLQVDEDADVSLEWIEGGTYLITRQVDIDSTVEWVTYWAGGAGPIPSAGRRSSYETLTEAVTAVIGAQS